MGVHAYPVTEMETLSVLSLLLVLSMPLFIYFPLLLIPPPPPLPGVVSVVEATGFKLCVRKEVNKSTVSRRVSSIFLQGTRSLGPTDALCLL